MNLKGKKIGTASYNLSFEIKIKILNLIFFGFFFEFSMIIFFFKNQFFLFVYTLSLKMMKSPPYNTTHWWEGFLTIPKGPMNKITSIQPYYYSLQAFQPLPRVHSSSPIIFSILIFIEFSNNVIIQKSIAHAPYIYIYI
jgi:hypothetical protein